MEVSGARQGRRAAQRQDPCSLLAEWCSLRRLQFAVVALWDVQVTTRPAFWAAPGSRCD